MLKIIGVFEIKWHVLFANRSLRKNKRNVKIIGDFEEKNKNKKQNKKSQK